MDLDFEKENGLIPAIVQDHASGEVLMLGFMNREAYAKTRATGFVTFYSRSRQKLWTKGETSGQKLLLRELRVLAGRSAPGRQRAQQASVAPYRTRTTTDRASTTYEGRPSDLRLSRSISSGDSRDVSTTTRQ